MWIVLFTLLRALPISINQELENVNILDNIFGILEFSTNYTFEFTKSILQFDSSFKRNFESMSPMTLFLATDFAWSQLPVPFWNSPEYQNEIFQQFKYHIIQKQLIFKTISLQTFDSYRTLQGNDLQISRTNIGTILVRDGLNQTIPILYQSMVRSVVVYVIDTVLQFPLSMDDIFINLNRTLLYSWIQFSQLNFKTQRFTLLLPPEDSILNYTKQACGNQRLSNHTIQDVLLHHLMWNQTLYHKDLQLVSNKNLTMADNQTIDVRVQNKKIGLLNNTTFIRNGDIMTYGGGVLHQLTRLLLPKNISISCNTVSQ